MNHTVGACNEKFGFSQEAAIPEEIARLRNRSSLSKLENESRSEEIMEFHKEIALDGNYCERIFQDFKIDGIVDILRFNIRGWLDKMDNPGRRIFCPDPEHNDKIIAIRGHRVYHVNLLLRFGAKHSPDQYARYRLILSRNGIRAVESVPPEP